MYLALTYVFVLLVEWRVSDGLIIELKQNNEGTVTISGSGFPTLQVLQFKVSTH